MRKKLIIAAAAGVLALAAGLVLVLLHTGDLQPAAQYAVVYEKGSENQYVALPEGSYKLAGSGSKQQALDSGGAYFYYDISADADDPEALRSLYLMQLNKARSREEGGQCIAQGILAWAAADDGRCAVWLESKGRVLQLYDANKESTRELASGVDALYADIAQDVIFFTKADGALFRCNVKLGQQPERMATGVSNVLYCRSDAPEAAQALVCYRQQAGDDLDLYALGQTGGAVLVAQAPVKVFTEQYAPGGNLYFLKQAAAEEISVTVTDPQKESDAAMKQPQKPASSSSGGSTRIGRWLSSIFGGGSSSGNNSAYTKEKAAYDLKLERDKVRAAAKDALANLPENKALLDCYVYDGESARLLASGLQEKGTTVLRAAGRPAVLYEKQRSEEDGEAELERTVTLDSLLSSYRSGGADAVREAIFDLAGGNVQQVGHTLAMMSSAGPSEVPLGLEFGSRAGWEARFVQGRETLLYMEKDVAGSLSSLYSFELTEYGLSERKLMDLDVESISAAADGLYYKKQEADVKGTSLFYCAWDGSPQRVLQGAGAFVPAGDALLAMGGGSYSETLYLVSGAASTELDTGVRPESVTAGNQHTGYLTQWKEGAGELRICSIDINGKNAKPKTLDTGVTAIRAVK